MVSLFWCVWVLVGWGVWGVWTVSMLAPEVGWVTSRVLRLFGGAARLGSCHLEGDLSWKRKKEKKEKYISRSNLFTILFMPSLWTTAAKQGRQY